MTTRVSKKRKAKRVLVAKHRPAAPPPSKGSPYAAHVLQLPAGGHKWTLNFDGSTVTTTTSGSSVSTIKMISSEFAPALKRLAEK